MYVLVRVHMISLLAKFVQTVRVQKGSKMTMTVAGFKVDPLARCISFLPW